MNLQCIGESSRSVIVLFAALWLFSDMLPHAFSDYLIVIMLRYACIAGNGVAFLQCVSKCAFSDYHLDWLSSHNLYTSVASQQCELGSGSSN